MAWHLLDVSVYFLLAQCTIIFRSKSWCHNVNLSYCTSANAYIRVKGQSLDNVMDQKHYLRDLAFTLDLLLSFGINTINKSISPNHHQFCPLSFSLTSRQIHNMFYYSWGLFSFDPPINTVRSQSICLWNTLTCKNCMQTPKNNSCITSSYWLRVSYCFIFMWCGGNTSRALGINQVLVKLVD